MHHSDRRDQDAVWRVERVPQSSRLPSHPFSRASPTRNSLLPQPSLEESPSTSTSPLSSKNRPLLNPLNTPLNDPVSRFSVDTQTVFASQLLPRIYTASPLNPNTHSPLTHTQSARSKFHLLLSRYWRYAFIILLDVLIAVTVVCVASLLSMAIGHLILRAASRRDISGPFDAAITTTIQAGVLGGAIIALPLAIMTKILFPPRDTSLNPPSRSQPRLDQEDFLSFDSHEDEQGRNSRTSSEQGGIRETTLTRYHAHRIFAFMFCECVGLASGPLGVVLLRVCYAGRGGWTPDADIRLLDPTHAVEAGAVGGAIAGPGILILIWVLWKLWTKFFTPRNNHESSPRVSWY
ncbi:hypothetical protein BDN71DRAFT_545924 [Pleurotus eryngii]|uniref:Uncharacterized protein n=1 Tax=Pleurotus eryngii TaxID=5323 RepID=A0A9P5ZHA3_PLEER|nr:hypothetical protein BDN71DRAFT_545924 [Pleurotus eryngii]